MQLVPNFEVTVPVKPLPVRKTTGPADWKLGPMATLEYTRSATGGRAITDSVLAFVPGEFLKLPVTSYEAALEAARTFSTRTNGAPVDVSVATAVLQAADGAWYLAHLGQSASSSRSLLGFPHGAQGTATGAETHIDALRAIVGGTMYVEFPAPPA